MAKNTEPVVQTSYLRVLEGRAPTLSGSSAVQYLVLADMDRREVFLLITAAEGGGNYNREVVSLEKLEAVVDTAPADRPFGSKHLKTAFAGRSNNNAPYICAVLIDSGLLAASLEVKHGLHKAGDWNAWKTAMLAREGGVFLFPPAAPLPPQATPASPAQEGASPGKKNRRGGNRLIPVEPPDDGDAALAAGSADADEENLDAGAS